jgi:hypothetical protein
MAEEPIIGSRNDLPYLNQPILPLAVALSRMLEEIETKLANKKIGAAEKWQLRLRAGLIPRLLKPNPSAGVYEAATRGTGVLPI